MPAIDLAITKTSAKTKKAPNLESNSGKSKNKDELNTKKEVETDPPVLTKHIVKTA